MNTKTLAVNQTAIYIRVSTDKQAEKGYSISEQEAKLRAMCSAHGLEVYKAYVDDGYTGSDMNRPALQELLQDIKEGLIENVATYKLDRLSRDMQDMLKIIREEFLPSDINLMSVTENIDTSTPVGRAALNLLAAYAELEKDTICERMKMGKVGRAKAGKWMGGSVPFGYDYEKESGILIPNRDATLVKTVFGLYLLGYGIKQIAETLELKSDMSVVRILECKLYTGKIYHDGQFYEGQHEPIINDETYQRAAELRQRHKFAKTGSSTPYLLVGLLYCGKCGAKMGYAKQKHFTKISCHSRRNSTPHLIKDPNCSNPRLRSVDVESYVTEELLNKVDSLKDSWAQLDTEDRRIAFRSRIEKIVVADGNAEIHWLNT